MVMGAGLVTTRERPAAPVASTLRLRTEAATAAAAAVTPEVEAGTAVVIPVAEAASVVTLVAEAASVVIPVAEAIPAAAVATVGVAEATDPATPPR